MATPLSNVFDMEPYALAAALFHLFYNVILFLMLIGFVRPLAKLATVMIRDKAGDTVNGLKLHFIDEKTQLATVPATPESFTVAKAAVLDETVHMAKLAHEEAHTAKQVCEHAVKAPCGLRDTADKPSRSL